MTASVTIYSEIPLKYIYIVKQKKNKKKIYKNKPADGHVGIKDFGYAYRINVGDGNVTNVSQYTLLRE